MSERRGIRQKQRVAKYKLHLDSLERCSAEKGEGRREGGERATRGEEMMKKSTAQTNAKYAIGDPNHAKSCNLLDVISTL